MMHHWIKWIDGHSPVWIGAPKAAELNPYPLSGPMPVFDMFDGREVILRAPGCINE